MFDGAFWAASWEKSLKMSRDVLWMEGQEDRSGSSSAEDFAACQDVHRGAAGEEWNIAPKSLRVCARAIAGSVSHSRLLGFNIIVSS
jgi:hypothetical protein